jgi:hypothetical protein
MGGVFMSPRQKDPTTDGKKQKTNPDSNQGKTQMPRAPLPWNDRILYSPLDGRPYSMKHLPGLVAKDPQKFRWAIPFLHAEDKRIKDKSKAEAAENSASMDAEAAVRIVIEHMKFTNRIGNAIQELEENDKSDTLAMEYLREDLLVQDTLLIPVVEEIPAECLDRLLTGNKTVRDLLLAVAMQTETNELLDAVNRKLELK